MDAATITILLSWAVHLTGYPAPLHPPEVEFKVHAFFVENACGGRDCDAVGWYNDKDIVYLDERLRDRDDVFVNSITVHEFVHYLQDLSGKYDSNSCADQIIRERDAYAYQRSYVAEAYGEVAFIRQQQRGC